jgi:MFS family permease
MMTIFYGIGAMVNPLLAGILTDFTGTFRWAFGVGVIASVAGGLVISFLGRPKQPVYQGD